MIFILFTASGLVNHFRLLTLRCAFFGHCLGPAQRESLPQEGFHPTDDGTIFTANVLARSTHGKPEGRAGWFFSNYSVGG